MRVAGREFSDETIDRIGRRVESDPTLTRTGLSREVCAWLDWRGADGRLKDMSCRVALLKLARRGRIVLPQAQSVAFSTRARVNEPGERSWPVVEMTLTELGEVSLVPVDGEHVELSRQWWSMMREHHPLGDGPLCGAQLRYLVHSRAGFVGGLSFSAPAWRLGARDAWIGWDEAARQEGLSKVVGNSRFLILPTVITHISEGFDFLSQNVRKYSGKLLIKPARKSIKALMDKVSEVVQGSKAATQEALIAKLNPIIRGWAMYHRHVVAKSCFSSVDRQIWQLLRQWAVRRHPTKSAGWIKHKYFHTEGNRHRVFATDIGSGGFRCLLPLFRAETVAIVRHVKIISDANPYNPEWNLYFKKRHSAKPSVVDPGLQEADQWLEPYAA
jgi:RNA-directed DNA polymerase